MCRGDIIDTVTVEQDDHKKYLFELEFKDKSVCVVTYTDEYIEFNGTFHKPLEAPAHLIGNLFAAYF